MYKKKSFFITFEGIEGSGKSYQALKLYKKLKKLKLASILTREPGGTKNAERIRKLILEDYFDQNSGEKFDKYTDTQLYLAAINEHILKVIKPALTKKKIVICDRFIDSTLAYQVYGKKVDKKLVNVIHKHILNNINPNITFILKVNINAALKRLNKRKIKNRYDKFSKNFYINVQKAFLNIAKKNKRKYFVLDNSEDNKETENVILKKTMKLLGV